MKKRNKILIWLLAFYTSLSSVFVVNAAHLHTESCYKLEGYHEHSGDVINGGGVL